jgi:hypothetical protein
VIFWLSRSFCRDERCNYPLSENPNVHSQKEEKTEPLSQKMHLKILHLSSGLKMSEAVEKLLLTYL